MRFATQIMPELIRGADDKIVKGSQCRRCLYTTSHPFGLTLDETGLCSGCITHSEKETLDWVAREKLLGERLPGCLGKRERRDYDCVVPVRGTPEYFYVLDVVINRFGLNPLVVAYNSQFNSRVGIRNFDLIREVFDVDIQFYTSNPFIYKKLIRESLVRFNSMRWPFIAGDTQFPVAVAVEKKIPLIVWPYHQPTEQAGTHSYMEENEMTRRGRHEYDLMGCEPQEMARIESLIRPTEVEDITYPEDRLLQKYNVRGIYLSNYYPWDTRRYSEEMIEKYGVACAKNWRTFDTYDRIDDATYMNIHDLLKQAKLGYSRVTDNLCREIRFGRLSREDALLVEKYYQSELPREAIKIFCDWLGVREDGYGWLLKHVISLEPRTERPELNEKQKVFVESFKTNFEPVWDTKKYIVYGKGLEL